jgi:hypothetical protein
MIIIKAVCWAPLIGWEFYDMLFEHLYYDCQYQLNQMIPGEEYMNAFKKPPPVSPRIAAVAIIEDGDYGATLGNSTDKPLKKSTHFIGFESTKKKTSLSTEVKELLLSEDKIGMKIKKAQKKQQFGPKPDITLVKMTASKDKAVVEKHVDCSVSNMMSLVNSDNSPNDSEGDRLEKELNITEYELRIKAAQGFEADQYSDGFGTHGVDKRISDAYATDGHSEISTSKKDKRRKTEIVSSETVELDFVIQHDSKELKRSVQEPNLKISSEYED